MIPRQWTEHLAGGDPRLSEDPEKAAEVVAAMQELASVLQYPTDHHGNVMDLTYILAPLAYHLALAGARIVPEKALIKAQGIDADGIAVGAVSWVGADAPETCESESDDGSELTLSDLAKLSPVEQAAALQRAGMGAKPDPGAGWHTKTEILVEE